MQKRAKSVAALIAALVAVSGFVVEGDASAHAFECPELKLPSIRAILLPPPCDSCAITKAELAELQALQRNRTPEMVRHASADYVRTPDRFLWGMGFHLNEKDLGASAPVLECAGKAAERAVDHAKTFFNRTRPYKLPGAGLLPLKKIGADDAPSFPSGHSAFGSATGLVLSFMDPDMKDRFAARIEDFGYSRLVSGVHFRSDVYAGETVGAIVATALMANESFRTAARKAAPDVISALRSPSTR